MALGVPPAVLALGGCPGSPCPPLCFFFSSSEVGGNAERGVWWCPCQLLPPSQRAGERLLCVPVTCVSLSPPQGLTFSAPQVQVGVELEANTRLQDTTFAFGYQLNLPQANMVFRGERGAMLAPGSHSTGWALTLFPPQGSWTVTGVLGGCWRRSCPPCLSPSLWAPSSTTGRTVSTAASVSSWAEGPQRQAARATVLLREPPCHVAGALAGPRSHAVVPGEPAEGGHGPSWLGDTV